MRWDEEIKTKLGTKIGVAAVRRVLFATLADPEPGFYPGAISQETLK